MRIGDGSAIRDFIYIDDVCGALHFLGTTKVNESIFNVGSGQGWSLNQIIETMEKVTGIPLPIIYAPSRFVDIPVSVLDIYRAKQLLGYDLKFSLEQGLAETFAFHEIKMKPQITAGT